VEGVVDAEPDELAFRIDRSVLGPSRGMERSNKASMGSIQVSLEDDAPKPMARAAKVK